jgi:hypothetical protein
MIRKKINNWDAIISFDKETKIYTIAWSGRGGAIICDSNLEEAERKWIEAMNVSVSVKKLFNFRQDGELK